MAQYYAVLEKAIGALRPNTSEARRAIYEKARGALVAQLKAIQPPLSTSEISRQRLELEEAIRKIEREALLAAPVPPAPPPQTYFHDDPPYEDEHAPVIDDQRSVYGMTTPTHDHGQHEAAGSEHDDYWHDEDEPQPGQSDAGEAEEPSPAAAQSRSSRREARSGVREPVIDWRPTEIDDEEPAERPARGRGRRARTPQPERPRRSIGAIIVSILLLAAIGVLGFVGWSQRGFIGEVFTAFRGDGAAAVGSATETTIAATPAVAEPPKVDDRIGGPASPSPAAPAPAVTPSSTPRPAVGNIPGATPATPFAPIDPAPGAPTPAANPPTAVAALDQAAAPPPTTASWLAGPIAALAAASGQPVQRAVLSEAPASAGGAVTRTEGSVRWVYVANGPEGPTVAGDVLLPSLGLRFRIFLHRNGDPSVPVSHLIEILPETPTSFAGGGIKDIMPIQMKEGAEALGQALAGTRAKVTDGLHWIGLDAASTSQSRNMQLLGSFGWMDVPIVYANDRRAILTLELGSLGQEIVDQAIAAWTG